MWLVVVTDNQFRLAMNVQQKQVRSDQKLVADFVACPRSLTWSAFFKLFVLN